VHPSVAVSDKPEQEHICELRRSSKDGRDAFDALLRALAIGLQRTGHAKRYASGFEIYPETNNADDFGEYSMYGYGNYPPSGEYDVKLDSDSVERLTSFGSERTDRLSNETLRLIVKCSAGNRENCEVLMGSAKLADAVHRQLSIGSQPSMCYNALKLIELGATAPKNVFSAVVRNLLVFCGNKPSCYKGIRSRAIENAALGAMGVLVRRMQEEERNEAMRTVEKDLFGKVREYLFREVQAICSHVVLAKV